MNDNTKEKPIDVLLAEDNPGDVILTQKAFEKGKILNKLFVVNNGIEALKFLRKQEPYRDSPTPDLILLDLRMPEMDGIEVLSEIKKDATLKIIPVIILTTSEAEQDILKSYELYANAYLTKPVDFKRFLEVVEKLDDFWFHLVKLPPKQKS